MERSEPTPCPRTHVSSRPNTVVECSFCIEQSCRYIRRYGTSQRLSLWFDIFLTTVVLGLAAKNGGRVQSRMRRPLDGDAPGPLDFGAANMLESGQ